MQITHQFVSVKADSPDATIVQPSQWNDTHTITGFPLVVSTDYNFDPITPGVPLTAGITNTITLAPVPLGVNGADIGHYLHISGGGSGGFEEVLITGGTAVSGAASGTITFFSGNNHTGNWTIRSATAGIQEAISTLTATGGEVYVPPGAYTLNANVSYGGKSNVTIYIQSGVSFSGSGTIPVQLLSTSNNYPRYNQPGPGRVVMQHDTTGHWRVTKPGGSLLDITGSTTSGLQEAITWAVANGFHLDVYGGWLGNPTDQPKLVCTTAVTFPPLVLWSMRMYAVNIYFTDTGATDGYVIDSCDLTELDFGNGQIFFQPSGSPIHFNPTNDNGEDLIGITSSIFKLPLIAQGNTTGGPQQGNGVRFSMPYTAGHALGSGLIVNNRFDLGESNGGHIGVLVDNPVSPNVFALNHINAHSVHGQDVAGVKVGTSAAAADLIYGNTWKLNVSAVATAVEIWGGHATVGGDIYDIVAGTALILGTSATNNLIRLPVQLNGTITNNATAKTNKLLKPGIPTRAVITPTSTVAIANNTMMPCTYIVSGGTVTVIALSVDNSTYDTTGEITGAFYVPAGGYIKITFSVAPTVTQHY